MSEDFWSNLVQDYALYAAGASTIVTGLIVIYKKAVKPMVKAITSYYKTIEKIDRIFEELTPNGGSSVKDKIDRMDSGLALVQQVQQAMAADTKAALFRTDSEGNCVWVNRTYTRTVGMNMSEILGHGWQNGISQDDRDDVVTEWYKSVEENREFSMNFNFETPDGIKTLCKCRSYKLVDSRGELIGYWGHCQIL